MINDEGGVDLEQFRMAAVLDRAETTGDLWLGANPRLRALPRPQVRPVHAEGVLPLRRVLQQHRRGGGLLRAREQAAWPRTGLRVRPRRELDPLRRRVEDELLRVEEEYRRPAPELDAGFAEWEREMRGRMAAWTRRSRVRALSAAGATLEIQPDCSVMASGRRGEMRLYAVWAETSLESLAGLRLEVLTIRLYRPAVRAGRGRARFWSVASSSRWRPATALKHGAEFSRPRPAADFTTARDVAQIRDRRRCRYWMGESGQPGESAGCAATCRDAS